MTRVLVCGGRHYNDARTLNATLDAIKDEVGITAIIHGGAGGADHLAGLWAHFYGMACVDAPSGAREIFGPGCCA
ncbi:DUF2493 domain-containing protein [Antarcticirhabdus aurantiaca]|uniref:DUF2493 domain-containing protein n=1 Tax=Antarcticirhabdus aurantiaca TaxID=2606717 RepID=A0ACD4NJY3_9HYPH|nr:DUF2493 domain-containing protein [Antarcticirhabdus aurantiaca]WAJ27112.1 DUF2493 domain-containing protein [Jeongeuplla avenae]